MSDTNTRADSIHIYLTGAASDGAAQASITASLGNYRSSSELSPLGISVASPISNLTINYADGANGTGAGTLTATGSSDVTWTPPGGSAGPAVTIANGETKVLEGGGASGVSQYIRISRTSATALTGTATVTLAESYNNGWGYSNINAAFGITGGSKYWGLMLSNEATASVSVVKVYVLPLVSTNQTSGSGQLGSSGSGTISTGGSFSGWPDSGYVRIEDSGGTLREIVYYSSRTNTVLTVPTAGRALLGTSAAAGSSSDKLWSVPGIRIAKEALASGHIQTIANDASAPSGVTWTSGITSTTGLDLGDLAAGGKYGLWIHRHTPAGASSAASILNLVGIDFETV